MVDIQSFKEYMVTRPVLRYFGGKWKIAPWIIEHLPPHRIYCEPFGGGASVLLRKTRSYAEVYNDLNSEVVNVFQVLRDPVLSKKLERLLRLTPFSRDEFLESYKEAKDPTECARRTIVRAFMGFGSNSVNRKNKTGFRANSKRSGTTPAQDWRNYPACVKFFSDRLSGVIIENKDYARILEDHDSPDTVFYVDPPYVQETRKKNCYQHEFNDADHAALLERLKGLSGAVLLSGYEHPSYFLPGWEHKKKQTFADGARPRTEMLWLNLRCQELMQNTRLL